MLEAVCTACCNATLLSGDPSWLELFRMQVDELWSLRKEDSDGILVPNRHGDGGWFDYEPHHASGTLRLLMHAYVVGRCDEDMARIEQRYGDRPLPQADTPPGIGKAGSFDIHNWFEYLVGRNPEFPQKTLEATQAEMRRRLDRIDSDSLDWRTWRDEPDWQDVHHWQEINPVVPEGLMQMAMGTPAAIYHGGIVHATVRYFDPAAQRPGLPAYTAALVEPQTDDGFHVNLVNTDILEPRDLIIQAGAFAEHEFIDARVDGAATPSAATPVDDRYVRVRLGPAVHARIHCRLKRLCHQPTYDRPSFD
jgi:hypothetical protein